MVLPSSKAMELIEKSRIRATEKTQIKVTDKKPKTVTEVVRKPRPRSRQKTYQPATRLKRLDRSKHMEYKYEMNWMECMGWNMDCNVCMEWMDWIVWNGIL